MGWILRPQTLGVLPSRTEFWLSSLAVVAVIVAAVIGRNKVPGGSIAIALGLVTGYWLSLIIFKKLSRDLHVATIAGFTGMSAEGLLMGISEHLDVTFTNVLATILKLAGVLGPAVLATVTATGWRAPSLDIVNAGVVAFLVVFLIRLLWKLPNNPPSTESVVSNSHNYTQEERIRISNAFPPANAAPGSGGGTKGQTVP